MQLSPIGLPVSELDTPALLLDLDAARAQHRPDGRPLPRSRASRGGRTPRRSSARRSPTSLRRAGAIGVTVAKVSEAEVMAAGGIDDILIAHLVVGPSKAARLAALQHQADVKVTVDHPDHVAPLGQAADGGRRRRSACWSTSTSE